MKDILTQLFGEAVTDENFAKFNEELGKRFVAKTDYNAKLKEIEGLNGQIAQRDGQLKTLQDNAGSNKELQDQIKKLQEDNKAAEEAFQEQLAEVKMNAAIDSALLKANAIDADLVKVKLDKDGITLKEDGSVEGLSEQLDSVKKDFGFLFKSENAVRIDGVKPADGSGSAGNAAVTKEEYQKMTYTERLKLKIERPEVYSELTQSK